MSPLPAPPVATAENVIRRPVYQNSNTLVEVVIRSKDGWPTAVPLRKDGRPMPLPLPNRPAPGGRRLPTWREVLTHSQTDNTDPAGRQGQEGHRSPERRESHRSPEKQRQRHGSPKRWEGHGSPERRESHRSPERQRQRHGSPKRREGHGSPERQQDGFGSPKRQQRRDGSAERLQGAGPAGRQRRQDQGSPETHQSAAGAGQRSQASVQPRPGARPAAGATGGPSTEPADNDQFKTWTKTVNQLIVDIKKRPAIAHLRPLLNKLESTVRSVPMPVAAHAADMDERDQPDQQQGPLREASLERRLEEIQQENEELQKEVGRLKAAVQQCRAGLQEPVSVSSSGAAGEVPVRDGGPPGLLRTELDATKHQLAKYKKYAKELKKTKENLLSTLQTMEESHAAELKSLREEHEAQLSAVLAQISSETQILGTYRADAEAVQKNLTARLLEIDQLKQTLQQRDEEIARLNSINRTLQEIPFQLMRILDGYDQSCVAGLLAGLTPAGNDSQERVAAVSGAGGAGDAPDLSLPNLEVTEPRPARPFPGQLPDLSAVSSTAGSFHLPATSGAEQQQQPADGEDFLQNLERFGQRLTGLQQKMDQAARALSA